MVRYGKYVTNEPYPLLRIGRPDRSLIIQAITILIFKFQPFVGILSTKRSNMQKPKHNHSQTVKNQHKKCSRRSTKAYSEGSEIRDKSLLLCVRTSQESKSLGYKNLITYSTNRSSIYISPNRPKTKTTQVEYSTLADPEKGPKLLENEYYTQAKLQPETTTDHKPRSRSRSGLLPKRREITSLKSQN